MKKAPARRKAPNTRQRSKSSPTEKGTTSSLTRRLTPSEIDSLRRDKKEAGEQALAYFKEHPIK